MNPLHHINNYDTILGSASPRREELLKSLKIKFRILTSNKKEHYEPAMKAIEVPGFLSNMKYDDIIDTYDLTDNYLLITADTIVIVDDQILGKPLSLEEAKEMLNKLSNRKHEVITGITIGTSEKTTTFSDKTIVEIDKLTKAEINWYVNQYNVLDKAGGYGIQNWFGTTKVKCLQGSYYNVMGLPVNKIYHELLRM